MRRAGMVGALVLLVLVNGMVLAGIAWNRSGAPEAALLLTERELALHRAGVRTRENTGVALTLVTAWEFGSPPWLDEAKLRSLGFEPERHYRLAGNADEYDKHPLPRQAYVVLEFDGPAWAALVQDKAQAVAQIPAQIEAGKSTEQHLARAREELARMRLRGSRLVPVDAGNDPQALRAKYPDRTQYAITPAEIRMTRARRWYAGGVQGDVTVHGYIARILTGAIHVPVQFHAALEAATAGEGDRNRPPRYAVQLQYGKRYEPWVEAVHPLDAGQ